MKRLEDLPLSSNDREAIREAAGIVRSMAPVERIVLFGSKARGDDDEESDIDLLVVVSRNLTRPERHRIVDAVYSIQIERNVVLSLVIVSAGDWRDGLFSALPIHQDIEDQGAAA